MLYCVKYLPALLDVIYRIVIHSGTPIESKKGVNASNSPSQKERICASPFNRLTFAHMKNPPAPLEGGKCPRLG